MSEVASVIKNEETCIQIQLMRGPQGLTVVTKVHPRVEEFMRQSNKNQKVDLGAVSRLWLPTQKDKPLLAWNGERLGQHPSPDGSFNFTLDQLGQPLYREGLINLSFLRLVGISEDAGIGFCLKGVHSIEALRDIKEKIAVASRKFYVEFLRPVDMSIRVSSMELRL